MHTIILTKSNLQALIGANEDRKYKMEELLEEKFPTLFVDLQEIDDDTYQLNFKPYASIERELADKLK